VRDMMFSIQSFFEVAEQVPVRQPLAVDAKLK
jgi:hypothetical protein